MAEVLRLVGLAVLDGPELRPFGDPPRHRARCFVRGTSGPLHVDLCDCGYEDAVRAAERRQRAEIEEAGPGSATTRAHYAQWWYVDDDGRMLRAGPVDVPERSEAP